jgi:hypothetical protein
MRFEAAWLRSRSQTYLNDKAEKQLANYIDQKPQIILREEFLVV